MGRPAEWPGTARVAETPFVDTEDPPGKLHPPASAFPPGGLALHMHRHNTGGILRHTQNLQLAARGGKKLEFNMDTRLIKSCILINHLHLKEVEVDETKLTKVLPSLLAT